MKKQFNYSWKNNLFNLIFAVLTLIIILFLYKSIMLSTILLLSLSIIALIKWKSKITLLVFIFGAIFGALAEIIAINFGIWSYSTSNFINIPLWLLILWGNAAIFIYHMALGFRRTR